MIDDENNILASAAVYVGDEPTYHEIYNGAWQTENKIYGIVHRIMAANHAKKRGAASLLMTYCAKLSLEAGVTSMRCDTHPGNIIMQHTLEKKSTTPKFRACDLRHRKNSIACARKTWDRQGVFPAFPRRIFPCC